MAIEGNKRGAVRKRSDPIALATQGRQTTYEYEEIFNEGVPTKLKLATKPLKLIIGNNTGKTYVVNYTLNTDAYPGSRKGLTFDIATGATNAS